jgi:hypothetical protein
VNRRSSKRTSRSITHQPTQEEFTHMIVSQGTKQPEGWITSERLLADVDFVIPLAACSILKLSAL